AARARDDVHVLAADDARRGQRTAQPHGLTLDRVHRQPPQQAARAPRAGGEDDPLRLEARAVRQLHLIPPELDDVALLPYVPDEPAQPGGGTARIHLGVLVE